MNYVYTYIYLVLKTVFLSLLFGIGKVTFQAVPGSKANSPTL